MDIGSSCIEIGYRVIIMSEDGQPDEAKEWEDYEGPQELPTETDPWNIAKEEFKKRRKKK